MKLSRFKLSCLPLVLFVASVLHAQARKELSYDWQPSQITGTYQWTVDDYSLRVSANQLQRTRLNGGAIEYAFRHFYPWEIVGAAEYAQGQPLSQHLVTVQAGLGYCRGFRQWIPFGRILLGMARTSSPQEMYLYPSAKTGFALGTSVGTDYQISRHFGFRLIQIQNQYLPFGSRGSVYWSVASGVNYRIHP